MGTRFLQREGGRIGYEDPGGPGPLVVCAPGMGDVRGVYRLLAPRLAEAGYRVVTMDVRGHGESSTGWPDHGPAAVGGDLLALVRELDAGPATLVGSSFTPASAIWAAAEAPELVSGIVLIAPWATEPELSPVMRLLTGLVGRSPALWARFYRSLYPTAPPADLRAYLRRLRANLAEPGRMAALRAMMRAPKTGCNARIDQVRCPVLAVMGSRDPDFPDPEAEAHRIADRAADGTVVMIEGAGHYPQAELPEPTAAAILPFLARATARGRAG